MVTCTKRLYVRLQADLGAEFDQAVVVQEGSNSLVCSARRIFDDQEVAIKVIDCKVLIDDEEALKLLREIQALKYFTALKAPVCVRYEDSFYAPAKEDCLLYIVTEKMDQSFAEVLNVHGHLPEEEAKSVFYEMLLITAYEHGCGWVHRDRKPENILFSLTDAAKQDGFTFQDLPPFTKANMQKYFVFKDCDFGLARAIMTDDNSATPTANPKPAPAPQTPAAIHHHSTLAATIFYKPLETLLREFDHVTHAAIPSLTAIDMWSNGVMLAEMLIGQVFPTVPYGMGGETECEIRSLLAVLPLPKDKKKVALGFLKPRSPGIRLLKGAVCKENLFERMASLRISRLAVDLTRRILDVDPAARLSALEALKHPWFDSVRDEQRQAVLFQGLPRQLDEWVLETHDKTLSVNRIKQLLHRTVSGLITEPMKPLKRRTEGDLTARRPSAPSRFATPSGSNEPEIGKLVLTPWGSCELVRKTRDGWNAVFSNHKLLHVKSSEILSSLASPSSSSSSPSSSSCSHFSSSHSPTRFVLPPNTPSHSTPSHDLVPASAHLGSRVAGVEFLPVVPVRPHQIVATPSSNVLAITSAALPTLITSTPYILATSALATSALVPSTSFLSSFDCLPTRAISPQMAFETCRLPPFPPNNRSDVKSTTITSTCSIMALALERCVWPTEHTTQDDEPPPLKRKRGRPRKEHTETAAKKISVSSKRGRPRGRRTDNEETSPTRESQQHLPAVAPSSFAHHSITNTNNPCSSAPLDTARRPR